jgi:hypothetical protein
MQQQTNQPEKKPEVRKPYHKPQIEQVRLSLEEAVLGSGCKTDGSSGPNASGACETNFTPCNIDGS